MAGIVFLSVGLQPIVIKSLCGQDHNSDPGKRGNISWLRTSKQEDFRTQLFTWLLKDRFCSISKCLRWGAGNAKVWDSLSGRPLQPMGWKVAINTVPRKVERAKRVMHAGSLWAGYASGHASFDLNSVVRHSYLKLWNSCQHFKAQKIHVHSWTLTLYTHLKPRFPTFL